MIEAPQVIRDQIIDQMIEDAALVLVRWVSGLDECNLAFRRREGICPCGVFDVIDKYTMHGRLLA
jgi:hypothetical protein